MNLFDKLKKKEPQLKMITAVTTEGFPIASTLENENLEYTFSAFVASIHNVATKALWMLDDLSELESILLQGSDSNFIFKSDAGEVSKLVIIVAAGKKVKPGFLEILAEQILDACEEKIANGKCE